MLDVARSFYGVEYVKQHIDRMALFKLNRLHLHLTDDQGWRIEIKSYPNLTNHGGSGAVNGGDAGFYTQAQYKEIQKYASDRYITVIPEIEMPGHIYAALASYPELNCPNLENLSPRRATPPELYTGVNVKWNSLCIDQPEVTSFVSSVLQEISEITQGPWIHIGGDEAEVSYYENFISFVDGEVYRLGKTPIGWEEILSAHTNKKTIAQIWTDDAPSLDNQKIISLCENFYLDQSNTPAENLPNDWCKRGVSLEDVYGFTVKNYRNVLGIEAPVWTEFANNQGQVDDRLWPRLAASAEVAWTPEANRKIKEFRSRLAVFGERFDLMGIHFFETPTVNWVRGAPSKTPTSIFFGFTP
jgi:hexosaminidase